MIPMRLSRNWEVEMNDLEAMSQAIIVCRVGLSLGQSPFGSAIVKNGELISLAHNTVRCDNDPTAHAEVNAIRRASITLETFDLSGCVLYSTCEPCPMCLAATHWSRVDRLVFGASIADAKLAGFREMPISATTMIQMGQSPLKVESGFLAAECRALFEEWKNSSFAQAY